LSTAYTAAITNVPAAAAGASATIVQATADATSTSFYVDFVADKEGSYTLLVSTGASAYTAGNPSTSFVVTTTGAPTALSVSSVGGSVVTDGSLGQLFALTMKDANGNDTVLGVDESILVSESDDTVAIKDFNGGALTAFAAGDDGATGEYNFRVTGGTVVAGSVVVTLKGSGLLPASLTTNTTATKVVTAAYPAGGVTVACTTGSTNCLAGFTVNGAAGLTISGFTSGATAVNHKVSVTKTAAGYTYDSYVTVAAYATGGAAAAATAAFTAPAPSAKTGATTTVSINGTTSTFTYGKPAAKAIAAGRAQTTILSATAASNSFVASVTDQYGNAIANESVTIKVAGRNTVAEKALGVTDANGLISYTLADAGTTGTTDVVTFTASGASTTKTAAYTVNYGTVTVDSVTVSGGSKAETIAGSTLTQIKAGDNGPEGSAVAIKAVVKDANGNLLAGVPVTFTVDAGLIVKTAAIDYATVYTGADGAASTSVFNWISGKQTVTATAGGKSSTDYLTWAANDATSARVLSAVATGDIVSLKVVDRFGNAVQGVTINLSRTGAGLFGNGASTQNIDTDKNGTADVRFIGSGTVVAELAATYAQAYAAAGNITTKAATAAVAGTTKGTGATLAPAGVAKVSVAIAEGADPVAVSSQAAADAAAEATDAANAATDAANAAAEAADAATAAAQDAADAVAALSTQVSEMVDALKKQITALTNLVIKIQKKVKA
jgi:hypothetical protein